MTLFEHFKGRFPEGKIEGEVETLIRFEIRPCFLYGYKCQCLSHDKRDKYNRYLCPKRQSYECWGQEYLIGLPTDIKNSILDKFMKLW